MTVAAEPGLTPRGRRTRAALVRAAAGIFERDGFVDARIADIAARAEVAIGTFYTYFDSKDAIFREVADVLIDELYQQSHVGDVAGSDPRARIEAANRLYVQALARHAGLYSVVIQVASISPEFRSRRQASRRAFVERAARGLRQLQEAGRADPGLDAGLTAAMLCGMVENFAEVRHLLGEPFEDDRAVQTMTDIWCRAIGLAGNRPGDPAPAGG
ncbi:MAG TPA: TetR/AcrR family transcriptional regulator [Acidimicrobiales bacterium]|nr:TetR/AcrR family transcriptional regulator [Acidimicrobiales bacterium]